MLAKASTSKLVKVHLLVSHVTITSRSDAKEIAFLPSVVAAEEQSPASGGSIALYQKINSVHQNFIKYVMSR